MNSTPTPPGAEPGPTLAPLPRAGSRLGTFHIVRQLGAGGMGVVYEARDNMGRRVALKVLRHLGAADVRRFKREFRSLEHLSHPNLVDLYELVASPQGWCFTMELVEGRDILSYLRSTPQPVAAGSGVFDAVVDGTKRRTSRTFARVRKAMAQLVEGVATLHDAGKMHRDIKPSNVLVSAADQRVVLVDFGLVADIEGPNSRSREQIVGTAPYIAPEQLGNGPPLPASDWYSVGVLLYEALTGRLPYEGTFLEIMLEKEERDPTPPQELAPWAPRDLCELCCELMHRDPEARPNAVEIRRRLGVHTPRARLSSVADVACVGREAELAQLAQTVDAARSVAQVVWLHAEPGVGKSRLVDELLRGLRKRDDLLVFAGRCHPRERIPFKALDGVIERLARWLADLPDEVRRPLMPDNASELSRPFPAFRRFEHRNPESAANPREQRRAALDALIELVCNLRRDWQLLIVIEDLHHGDTESVRLLWELLRACGHNVSVVVTWSDEDAEPSKSVVEFLDHCRERHPAYAVTELELLPLDLETTAHVVARGIGSAGLDEHVIHAIARAAGGNPRVAKELADHAASAPDVEVDSLTFADVLRARIAGLSVEERNTLQLIAVAGRPIVEGVVIDAARLRGTSAHPVHRLISARLVRPRSDTGDMRVDVHHELVRNLMLDQLDPARRTSLHRELAVALERADAPPEQLVRHWREAGDLHRASEAAERAGQNAFAALAFALAADHYRAALRLDKRRPRQARLLVELAKALAYAGHGREAAATYLHAAEHTGAAERLHLHQAAAEAFLLTGHVDEAYAALEEVMAAVSLKLPASPRSAIVGLLARRAWLRMRGMSLRKNPRPVSPDELAGVDLCRLLATGLGNIDPIMGAYFQARHTQLALRVGEASRLSVAMATEGVYRGAMAGAPDDRRALSLLDRADALADAQSLQQPKSFARLARGMKDVLTGHPVSGLEHCAAAERQLLSCDEKVGWEISAARLYQTWALVPIGAFDRLEKLLDSTYRHAVERSDLFTSTSCHTGLPNLLWLGRGELDTARDNATEAIAQWRGSQFHAQHFMDLLAQAHIDLAVGDALSARERVDVTWPLVRKSNLTRVATVRLQAWDLRGRTALAAAAAGRDVRANLAEARRAARHMARSRAGWLAAKAGVLRAGIAQLAGAPEQAVAHLRQVLTRCEELGAGLYTTVIRLCLAELIGGDEGAAMAAVARDYARSNGVSHPELLARVFCPAVGCCES